MHYYQYRQFCEHYSEWYDENAETLHFNAVIGEKMKVDFAGKTFEITDPLIGELCSVVVFVAVLPYSQYIYAERMLSAKEAVIQGIPKCRKYEVQTYRMCLGVLNFNGKYGKSVLEKCCRRAVDCGKATYTFIKNTISAVADEMGTQAQESGTVPVKKAGTP